MFAALLDTCVLWPSLQRDFLLSMAIEGLYRPLWSDVILDELREHEEEKLLRRVGVSRDVATQRAERLISEMNTVFGDAAVEGWEPLEGIYGLPDPDDEHVVAAAVLGNAGVIVTDNLRDFPSRAVPRHIDVQDAREFAANTASVDPGVAARSLEQIARRHRNPEHTPGQLLAILVDRYGMAEVGDLLGPYLDP